MLTELHRPALTRKESVMSRSRKNSQAFVQEQLSIGRRAEIAIGDQT